MSITKEYKSHWNRWGSLLYKAFVAYRVFPKALHLRCFLDFQQNIEDKLKQLRFPVNIMKEILHDITDVTVSSDRFKDLVDAANKQNFWQKLRDLKDENNLKTATILYLKLKQFNLCFMIGLPQKKEIWLLSACIQKSGKSWFR